MKLLIQAVSLQTAKAFKSLFEDPACKLGKLTPEKMHHMVFIFAIVIYSLFFLHNFQ